MSQSRAHLVAATGQLRRESDTLTSASAASFVLDGDGVISAWSAAAETLLRATVSEVVGVTLMELWRALLRPEQARDLALFFAPGAAHEGLLRLDVTLPTPEGTSVPAEVILMRLPLPAPHCVSAHVQIRDVSALRAEQQHEIDQRFKSLVEQIPAVLFTDSALGSHETLYIGPYLHTLVGYTEAEWMADPFLWERLVHPDDRERVLAEDARTNETGDPFSAEYRLLHRAGHYIWLREESVLIRDERGEPLYWQGVFFDIGAQKQLERELARHAFHDPLTGLPNRSVLTERLRHAVDAGRPLALIFVDLDNFKSVNDRYGHAVGDEIILRAVERIERCVRSEDLVARYAGDEFAVLVREVESLEALEAMARRMVAAFQRTFQVQGRKIQVTLSVGVAFAQICDQAPDELLRRADEAMYLAKSRDRNRYEIVSL